MQQSDIVRQHQQFTDPVPPGAVQCQHGKGALADLAADLLQMQVHGFDVGVRQHEPAADASRWADRAKQIGPFIPLIAERRRSAAPLRPDAG
jgi:hypothetical protein